MRHAFVSIDSASGFMARYSSLPGWGPRKPTHVAVLPEDPAAHSWAVWSFRDNPSKQMEFGRRLPLVCAV